MTRLNELIDSNLQARIENYNQFVNLSTEAERLEELQTYSKASLGTISIALNDGNSLQLEYSNNVIQVTPAPHLFLLVDGLALQINRVVKWIVIDDPNRSENV